jgi:hypothetical protein
VWVVNRHLEKLMLLLKKGTVADEPACRQALDSVDPEFLKVINGFSLSYYRV